MTKTERDWETETEAERDGGEAGRTDVSYRNTRGREMQRKEKIRGYS